MAITLDDLRRYAVGRSLFRPTTLKRALETFGFVQADPIRAPARAQDLILRHRVTDYRAGDLERRYLKLRVEEDFFVVYGFVTPRLQALMHPRADAKVPAGAALPWTKRERERAQLLLDFVRERGVAHPREVDEHFAHGKVTNYWGGNSKATTHLLSEMHYCGLLRVARRDNGIRVYAVHRHGPVAADAEERAGRLDALVDAAVAIYAPVQSGELSYLVHRLRYAAPQWKPELKSALLRAKERLAHVLLDGVDWYWPAEEKPSRFSVDENVRLLTPFDPIVWDRDRFESFWNWGYRFEAYTPVAKRKLGYYAMPVLWRDRVIGWANLEAKNGKLKAEFGYVDGKSLREAAFRAALEAEMERMRQFLGLAS
jgi:hypothetical protein